MTCGDEVLVAKLRRSDIDACAETLPVLAQLVERIRARLPDVRIILRGDSDFAREEIMTWCEANDVCYVLGLPRAHA
ncbi:MAG: transposase [Candidatus Hydrogenedentes bacterium]|nr:transposase [Candidatus Hydrogenedentota bacterium]